MNYPDIPKQVRILGIVAMVILTIILQGCQTIDEETTRSEITDEIIDDHEGIYVDEWEGIRQFGTSGNDLAGGVSVDASDDSYDAYAVGSTTGQCADEDCSYSGGRDILLVKYEFTGKQLWEAQLGSAQNDIPRGVFTNTANGVYITGQTTGDLEENTNQGDSDIFLTRYSTTGDHIWTELLGTDQEDVAYDLYADDNGVYLTGFSNGSLGVNIGSDYTADVIIGYFTLTGQSVWTEQFGASSVDDAGYGIAVDEQQNVYVAGYSDGVVQTTVANAGLADLFVCKYNSSRIRQWIRQIGTTADDMANQVVVDADLNVYVAGVTEGDLDGGGSQVHAGGADAFLLKYDDAGTLAWIRQFGTSGSDKALDVGIDTSGNLYVSGTTDGELVSGSREGLTDLFLVKYTSSGTRVWSRQWGTRAEDTDADVTVDAADQIYVIGSTTGETENNTNLGETDLFLTKFTADGTRQ